jgi:hypothetical protein
MHSGTVPGGQEVEEALFFNSYNRKSLKKESVDMGCISELISEAKRGETGEQKTPSCGRGFKV